MHPTRRQLLALSGGFLQHPASPAAPALTHGPRHHFFGYYGICPWNQSGRWLVCLESEFQDHLPRPEEAAAVGVVDARTGEFRQVAQTRAWNFQQGAMLHWNPRRPETEILFNDRKGDDIISVVLNVETGRRRELPRAINGISRDGRYGLCLTYGRLTRLRPVVGYVGTRDPNPESPHPDNDGVFVMDLVTGRSRLVVSIGEVYRRLVKRHPELQDRHMWFNHTVFNTGGSRFFFLARCWTPEPARRLESAMFTAGRDGSDLREVILFGKGVSHFEWRNQREILATFRLHDARMKLVLFTDGEADHRAIGEGFLTGDGHPTFAPDGDRIAVDHNEGVRLEKHLLLFSLKSGQGRLLARFPMREQRFQSGDLRCDLHPRWDRTGTAVCVDALDSRDGTRQLHVVNCG
ncbi:MAG: hypothetical protein FJW34_03600 [Acidobacteria bacterium]|nr:hypothetical protein [Acidobacteriota bacterium]